MMMNDQDYWQAQYYDTQRFVDWVNKEAWKFDPSSGKRSSRKRQRRQRRS